MPCGKGWKLMKDEKEFMTKNEWKFEESLPIQVIGAVGKKEIPKMLENVVGYGLME